MQGRSCTLGLGLKPGGMGMELYETDDIVLCVISHLQLSPLGLWREIIIFHETELLVSLF